jgi:hypothetical protein
MKLAKRTLLVAIVVTMLAAPAAQAGTCNNGRSSTAAMWYSILHPGLGEYYLKGWGAWSKMPPRKFWLGFIPFYGWPGYLQVKSAIDASNCRTNDNI